MQYFYTLTQVFNANKNAPAHGVTCKCFPLIEILCSIRSLLQPISVQHIESGKELWKDSECVHATVRRPSAMTESAWLRLRPRVLQAPC